MRLLPVVLVLTAPLGAAAERLAPPAVRDVVVGCWDVRDGATLTIRPFGKHSITYEARFATRPRGGPTTFRGTGAWIDDAFDVACRPRSQHGSFCRISPARGGLRVRVFSVAYDDRRRGKLVEDFVASRGRCPVARLLVRPRG